MYNNSNNSFYCGLLVYALENLEVYPIKLKFYCKILRQVSKLYIAKFEQCLRKGKY